MKKSIILSLLAILLFPLQAHAHFGMIIPSRATVTEKSQADLRLDLAFAHPFDQQGMDMQKPKEFFVLSHFGKIDLMPSLKETKFLDHAAWQGQFKIERPSVYQFAFVPQPYYEEAEDSFIIHYTKTIIGAFGSEDDWNRACGLPVEIIPLSRPFGNYAGNLFQGTALFNGKPLAGAIVEVENLNRGGAHVPPNEYFVTQTVMTDINGNFSFAVPWAGWWGFAVLTQAPEKIMLNGSEKDVELGGIIWMKFVDPVQKR